VVDFGGKWSKVGYEARIGGFELQVSGKALKRAIKGEVA